MAWAKGDREWHYSEGEVQNPRSALPGRLQRSTCELLLRAPTHSAPTDADPKCPVCDAAHP